MGEVAVLAGAEAQPGHVDGAAETGGVVVEAGDLPALLRGQQRVGQRRAGVVEPGGQCRPVEVVDASGGWHTLAILAGACVREGGGRLRESGGHRVSWLVSRTSRVVFAASPPT